MDAVETIKRQVELVEYIGRFTKLTRAGRNYRGLCPFHSEKTPSFYVFPERGTWRCFGACGEGGDLFTFVQKREGVDFRTALRQLAEEAGVRLQDEDPRRRSRLERLAAVMSAAVGFYERQLHEPAGQPALQYLTAGRGLTAETIAAWHLGWAPEGWRTLRDFLSNRGYTEEDLLGAGLLVEPEAGREPYDRFRARVVIPIANERGEFVAMGGRGLHGEEPKYLNSPQTELFDKGRTLFGLHLAGEAIRARGEVVVVEGYMDVLGPWQAGYRNVVATMGTSLTHEHAALLRRYARRIVLALDPDSAGLTAAERAGGLLLGLTSDEHIVAAARAADELATAAEIDLRVAVLPAGRDPDELVRYTPGLWEQAIASARPFAEFLVDRMMGAARPASPLEARHTVDRLRPLLLAVRDPVERAVYVQRVARHLGVEEEAVVQRLRMAPPPRRAGDARRSQRPEPLDAEDVLLSILLRYPGLRLAYRNYPESLFSTAVAREIFRRWVADPQTVAAAGDEVAERAERLLRYRLPPLSEQEARRAADDKVQAILRDRIRLHQAAHAELVEEAEKQLGPNRIAELALRAWRGEIPPGEEREVAESLLEEFELGLSIHRRETPRTGRGAI